MTINIKQLVQINKQKRETYLKEKKSESFQTALLKIENRLKQYNPSKAELIIDINSSSSEVDDKELCLQLKEELSKQGIHCTYKYDPGYSCDDDYCPSSHNLVFSF